jgi:hypothetical protein
MPNKCDVWALITGVNFALFFLPCIARPCSIAYPTVRVGTRFLVRVTDRGSPVNALRLVLNSYAADETLGADSTSSVTDKDGIATFSNVLPGSFVLAAAYDGGVVDAVLMNVSANGPTNVMVALRWPSRTPLSVTSISGVARGPAYYPSQKQPHLSFSLMEGLSGRVIATTDSDNKGRFNFKADTAPGVYFLRLNRSGLRGWSGGEMEGLIAIEVSPESKSRALDLDLGWSSCGLTYTQGEIHPESEIGKLCGDIVDSTSAAVADAQVLLMTSGEEAHPLEQTRSGMKGQFTLQDRHDGTYQLLIIAPGFQPFLLPIRVQRPSRVQGCEKPIHAILKAMF